MARLADEPMVEEYKPYVNALAVKRQDGTIGVCFKATTDEGETLTVTAEGKLEPQKLEVKARDASGRITRAFGDLLLLETLRKRGALATDPNQRIIAVVEKAPVVNFSVTVAHGVERGVLKSALHFIAGFVGDVEQGEALALLPSVLGKELAGGEFVRTWAYDDALFPESWPPRHELTSYPGDSLTYVSMLLFGVDAFVVRLPITTDQPLRYTQPLIGPTHPRLSVPAPVAIDWDRPLATSDTDAFMAEHGRRIDAISEFAGRRMIRKICRDAARRAMLPERRAAVRTDFFTRYAAELQVGCVEAPLIAYLLREGRRLRDEGEAVWHL
ncbi:MAG TPA: hypothetical protein VFO25_02645 [Candidatus Eremiobacteraceae bacterium]|nr:hypothetical protein [Candidatus Eremiobacteraceae bacterium]